MKKIDLMSVRELRKTLREAVGLLAIAKCPDDACGGQGWSPHQVGPDEWEQQQCQWCHEKSQLAEDG